MLLAALGLGLAVALAMNFGANNAGVHMAPAFGSGARSRLASLSLFAVFTAVGAVVMGEPVARKVGQDLFTEGFNGHSGFFLILAPTITLVILATANFLKVPMPTTPVAVCSLVGVGLYFGVVEWVQFGLIAAWWIGTPLVTLGVTYIVGKILLAKFPAHLHNDGLSPRKKRVIVWLLTLEGCYSAFAIGSNNVGNAIGPLLGSSTTMEGFGIVLPLLIGGLGFAAGTVLWGGRVLETVGKGITDLCYARALVVGMVASTTILTASIFGAPVSGALVVISSIMGFSLALSGARKTAQNRNVRRIVILWATGPVLAVLAAYTFVWIAG